MPIAVENSQDEIAKSKTIFDVSAFEIFWRNFLAGMARAFGGIIMYFIFIFVIGAFFTRFILPVIRPYVDTYMQSMESLQHLNGSNGQLDFNSILQQYQQAPTSPQTAQPQSLEFDVAPAQFPQ